MTRRPAWLVYRRTTVFAALMCSLITALVVTGDRTCTAVAATLAATLVLTSYNADWWRERARQAQERGQMPAQVTRLGPPQDGPP